jgi:chaperonin GroEL
MGSVIIDEIRRRHKSTGNTNIGYVILRGQFSDMLESSILDPVKVTRSTVENATSIAAMILSTDVLVTDRVEEKKAPAMNGMGADVY